MRLGAARVEPFRLALRRPLVTARGAIAEREGFLLHVTGTDGVTGSGEASPVYWLGEDSLAATAAALDAIAARVAARPTLAEARDWLAATAALPAAAACALDAALLDLEARARGVAASTLFGVAGSRRLGDATSTLLGDDARVGTLRAVGSHRGGGEAAVVVPIAALIGGRTPGECAAAADEALARGFRTLKLKVGGIALADDEARVAAVVARLAAHGAGDAASVGRDDGMKGAAHDTTRVAAREGLSRAALRLDANGAWTRAEAERALARLAPFQPEYVEEPLAEGGASALAALARDSAVPLAIDESLRDADDLARVIDAGTRVHVVLKAARVGGPTPLVVLARRALAAGLPVTVTDAIESGVGMRHAVHAAAALVAGAAYAHGVDGGDGAPVGAVGLGGAQLAPAEAALCRPMLAAVGPGVTVVEPGAAVAGGGGG